MKQYLGVDIGGTKIAGAIVTESGDIVTSSVVPTDSHLGGQHVLSSAINLSSQLMGSAIETIAGIGIGAGGLIDPIRGTVIFASSILPGWTGIDIAGGFKSRFNIPVCADNDVNALASGESLFGAAKGLPTVAFLALGTGVGGALIVNHKLHHGAHFSAGEVGTMIVDKNLASRSTLESLCCGDGLLQTFIDLGADVSLETSGRDVGAAALADTTTLAADAVRKTGEYLGIGLVNIANLFDPDMIVIGGGLASLGDLLLGPARQVLREHALPGPASCPVVVASLGAQASVIGAASLAIRAHAHE